MNSYLCFYHPKFEAVEKCFDCENCICLDCKLFRFTTGNIYSQNTCMVVPTCKACRKRSAPIPAAANMGENAPAAPILGEGEQPRSAYCLIQ